jgi:transposase
MDKYIGMDMDSKKTVVCIIQEGKQDRYATIGSDVASLRAFLLKQKSRGDRVHAAFEISGQAGYLYDHLVDCVESLKIVNPSKATWIYRTAKKNDRIDARKIAVLLRMGELPVVHMPAKAVRQWRQLILHRQKTVQKVGRVKNRIRALLKSEGYFHPGVEGGWWKQANRQWMHALSQVSTRNGALWRLQLGHLLAELAMLESQRDQVTAVLDRRLSHHAGGGLLMSIPGVGPRTAEAVLAYTDAIRRFENYKQYCAYFGLTPKLDESGSTRRLGHISKQGPSVVRWVLCESSWKVVRYCPALRAFYERVMAGQKNRKKIAIVAVARKLLCIMRAMQLTGEVFNERIVLESLQAA